MSERQTRATVATRSSNALSQHRIITDDFIYFSASFLGHWYGLNFVKKEKNNTIRESTKKETTTVSSKIITAVSFYIVIYIFCLRETAQIFIMKICNSDLCGLIFYVDTAGDQRPLRMIDLQYTFQVSLTKYLLKLYPLWEFMIVRVISTPFL